MVATSFALTVVYPVAGNITGGGFFVYRTAEGETGALDYREMAPLKRLKIFISMKTVMSSLN